MKWYLWTIAPLFFVLLVSGCTEIQADLPASTNAKDIVPDKIVNYTSFETNYIVSGTAAAVVGATAFFATGGADALLALKSAGATYRFVECYQEANATDSSGFYNTQYPLYAGFIVVGDDNRIKDPGATFFACMKRPTPFSIADKSFLPCFMSFTIKTSFNKFYVMVIGTDWDVCNAICDELPSCPG